MSKQYPEYAYFNGHRGTHYKNGIYKIDEPYVTTTHKAFNKDTNSYGILYKTKNVRVSITVMYFKDGYEDRWDLFEETFKSLSGLDLHYYEPIKIDEIGGMW